MASTVPSQQHGQTEIFVPIALTPYSPAWWTAQQITNIPSDSVGWLVAQGWQILGIQYDETTVPPTPYYSMGRESLQNWMILQSLLNTYTNAYNEAKEANSLRYNDVVRNWGLMLQSSQVHFEAQVTKQNAHVTLFMGDLGTYMDAVDALIEANQNQLVQDAASAATALTEMNNRLTDLETNVTVAVAEITSLLADQNVHLTTFLTDFAAELAELDTNFDDYEPRIDAVLVAIEANLASFVSTVNALLTTILDDYTTLETTINDLLVVDAATLDAHVTDYNAVLALLESDYALHSVTSNQFLIDLGATELARINEKFAASRAVQMQQLVDRGLYSAALAADVTARNSRDHNEEIVALNDRLMREKLENQHRLYGQQTQMRAGTMAGKDRVHGLRAELSRYHAAQVTGVYGMLQDVRNRTISTKQAIQAVQDAVSRLVVEVRTGLLATVNGIVAQQAAGIDRQFGAKLDVSRVAMTARERILGMLQDAVKSFLAGKERYAAMTMQTASTLAEHRHRAVVENMNVAAARLTALSGKHEEDMKLMAYQLDERNKLLVGIYGFVERREDVGPTFEDLSKVVTSLGDAGGGWITP